MTARRPLPGILDGNAIRVSEAGAFGISQSRLRASDVDAPFCGVRSAGMDIAGDIVARCRAAAVLMDEHDLFSHSTALALWRAPVPDPLAAVTAAVHISRVSGTTRMRRKGIAGHRLISSTPIRPTPDGLRAAAPATAWCQFAGQDGASVRDLVAVGDFLLTGRRETGGFRHAPICEQAELRAAVTRHGAGRGARMLVTALDLIRAGPGSRKETELRLVIRDAGLPEPVIGHVIDTRLGALEPDLAYPRQRVLLEYEGDHHRTNRNQWRGDFERVRAFQSAGWTVLRVNADDLSDPARRAALIDQVHRLLSDDGRH